MQVNNDDEQPKQADNLSRIYRFFCGKKIRSNCSFLVTTPPHKKVKKSLTGFWGLKIEMTLLQLIVLFIGMPRSLQRISQGVTDFASKNRF